MPTFICNNVVAATVTDLLFPCKDIRYPVCCYRAKESYASVVSKNIYFIIAIKRKKVRCGMDSLNKFTSIMHASSSTLHGDEQSVE